MMTTIEVVFYSINNAIGTNALFIADIGGSMTIHTFGAVFGMTVSAFYFDGKKVIDNKECSPSYVGNLTACIGTIFLFCFWPSFNGALGTGDF